MTEVSRETWDEIQRELREGTPNTPERLDLIRRADQLYSQFCKADFRPFLTWVEQHYAPSTRDRVNQIVNRYLRSVIAQRDGTDH